MQRPDLDSRRNFLLHALSTGALVGGLGWTPQAEAWFGRRAKRLPEGQSIFELDGRVLVNGRQAKRDTLIQASDQIEVGPGGKVVYAVGQNAYILRERSILQMQGKNLFVSAMRLINGAVMGVFGRRKSTLNLQTPTATIGIRGTAVYTRAWEDKTYACTCYGATTLQANDQSSEDILSRHHDAPRWILNSATQAPLIQPAPMFDHEDEELILLESLVGREVPFAVPPPDGEFSDNY